MMKIFRILLPTTFPMVIPAFLFIAAVILTAASGMLVPIATMVNPMINCGIPSFFAILAAPSTNQSAPFTRNKKPASLLEYICKKGVACRVDSVHFFVRTVIETYNSESDEIARLLL